MIQRYYDNWGWIYVPLWGETIHWGVFSNSDEPLSEAAKHWTERTIDLLQPRPSLKLLEVGCGPAVTSHQLIEKHNVSITAIDISEFQLQRARTVNSDYIRDGRLELIKGDIASATLPVGRFDGAFSEAVFFHLVDKKKCLANIRSALRTNAKFVFDDIILGRPSEARRIDRAFERFGKLEFLSQTRYLRMLQSAGFKTVDIVSATEAVAQTYVKLVGRLEELRLSPDCSMSDGMYRSLRTSFTEIVKLLRDGSLAADVFVAVAT